MSLPDRVSNAIQIMIKLPNAGDDELVEALVRQDMTALQAEIIVAFVPLAMGRVEIARMPGAESMPFPAYALISDFKTGKDSPVDFESVPEYVAALELASKMEPKELSIAASRSCELVVLKQLSAGGKNVAGVRFVEPVFCRLAEVPGFSDWYAGVCPKGNNARARSETQKPSKPWWQFW